MLQIHGFQTLTLLDYPEHIAATIFLGGCNFRCPFCHNKDLVLAPSSMPTIDKEYVLSHLKKRKNMLNGVVITGGEPTMYATLPSFIKEIKEIGYHVKLDTNGTNPMLLQQLIDEQLIDYVAMDIKHCPEKYTDITACSSEQLDKVKESVSILMKNQIPYEFRTTVVEEFHAPSDFEKIGAWIQGADAYYIQCYKDSEQVIQPGFHAYPLETLKQIQQKLTAFVPNTNLRGIDS